MATQTNPATQAIEDAEKACQAAIEATPAAYHGFITFLPQNKKVGGTRSNPIFATIRLPYMGVDGRIQMAQDQHAEHGEKMEIETEFIHEPISGQMICKATINSTLLGKVTGHARAFLDGTGVHATNPLETAETSAVGRALGFLGYGLFGTGIASAEEVVNAIANRETDGEQSPRAEHGPSEKQLGYIAKLIEELGMNEDEARDYVDRATTREAASEVINQLQARKRVLADTF
jgi:hypothetical protein